MKLYIANTTKQRQIFAYRKLETGRLIQIPINHGDQMMVLDGSTDEVDAVVQHHRVYGPVDSTKIDQSRVCRPVLQPEQACISVGNRKSNPR